MCQTFISLQCRWRSKGRHCQSFHSSISLLLGVLLSRMSRIISSVERLSFQAPAKRSAHPVSSFTFFSGARLFTYFNTIVSKVSSLAISLMARYSSAFNSNAVIVLYYSISTRKGKHILPNTLESKFFFLPLRCQNNTPNVRPNKHISTQNAKENANKT